jgi:hypothetical protein
MNFTVTLSIASSAVHKVEFQPPGMPITFPLADIQFVNQNFSKPHTPEDHL